jgi:O-antigen ligase
VAWLGWGHLGCFLFAGVLDVAERLQLVPQGAHWLILIVSAAVFVLATFWLLPNKPPVSPRIAMPVLALLVFYLTSNATAFAQRDAQTLAAALHGFPGYCLALLGTQAGIGLTAVALMATLYYCAANVPRPLLFGYMFFFSVVLNPIAEVGLYIAQTARSMASGEGAWLMRASVLSGGPNETGSLMLLYGAFGYALLGPTGARIGKAMLTVALAVIGICLVLTFSRGAWLGLVIMVGAAPPLLRGKRAWKWSLVAVAGFLVVLLFLSLFPLHRSLGGTLSDRVLIWHDALRVLATHPLFGVGMDNNAVRLYDHGIVERLSHAHNVLLNLLVEGGIVGAAIFVWGAVALWRRLRQITDAAPNALLRAQAFGLTLGIVGVLGHDLVDTTWRSGGVKGFVLPMLAATLGAAASARIRARAPTHRVEQNTPEPCQLSPVGEHRTEETTWG